jgi:Starch-binding associating with outer membrane
MKRLLPIILLLLASSCTKNLTGLNDDPKSSITAPSASVFLAGEKGLVDIYTADNWSSAPFRVIAQAWTMNTYNNIAHYQFATDNPSGGWWTALYTNVLSNLAQAKSLYATDVLDSNARRNDYIITDILEVYSYSLLVNTFGNVPYSQALNRTIPFPAYDDAKTIEYDLLHRLDTAIAGLNTAYGSFGEADQLYGGNTTQWKKFAATLKLKLSLLVADVDAATATAGVQAAIAAGVFTSNADNALLPYDASSVVNSNPIWQDLVNGANLHYYSPAAYFITTLQQWNDPRLPLLFTEDPNGGYSGGIAGAGNTATTLSSFSPQWLAAAFPGDILDYSETQFLLAEAVERGIPVGGTAEQYYDSAISASILSWGGTSGDVQTYLAQPSVVYATAAGPWRQKIGYQKWLAFANRNWDSWTEIRRLGYPDLDVVSPPVGAIGNLPLRLNYPPAEQTSNPTNWAAAVKALGGQDILSAKLFWQP